MRPKARACVFARLGALFAAALSILPANVPLDGAHGAPPAAGPAKPRLSPDDYKVFGAGEPLPGSYRLVHPVTDETLVVVVGAAPEGEEGLVGTIAGGGARILTLRPVKDGVGWEGEVVGLLSACGQDRVAISGLLPLGDKVILRVEARPPELPCAFLEDRSRTRLVVGPTASPIPLRNAREIVSESTREKIGLAGQPGGTPSPIVAGSVSVEGGTELRFIGRTRSLDGSVWIEVEALVSPAPGIEAPRGFVRAGELRMDGSLTLERISPAPPGS